MAALQRALKTAGYFSGTINGDFGSSTKTALEDWQGAHGLSETGEVTTSTVRLGAQGRRHRVVERPPRQAP